MAFLLLHNYTDFISVILSSFIYDIDLNNYYLGGNWLVFILGSLLSSLGIFYLFEQYYDRMLKGVKNVLSYIGKNSLSFMLLHFYLIIDINRFITFAVARGVDLTISLILGYVLLLVMTMLITKVFKKTKLRFLLAK